MSLPGPGGAPRVRLTPSDGLADWLYRQRVSVVLTTYEAGKVIVVSSGDGRHVTLQDRPLP